MARHLNKTLEFAVRFSFDSAELGIPPGNLARMIQAAEASAAAYARGDAPEHERLMGRVEELAHAHGCSVDWNGLWPTIMKNSKTDTRRSLPAYK